MHSYYLKNHFTCWVLLLDFLMLCPTYLSMFKHSPGAQSGWSVPIEMILVLLYWRVLGYTQLNGGKFLSFALYVFASFASPGTLSVQNTEVFVSSQIEICPFWRSPSAHSTSSLRFQHFKHLLVDVPMVVILKVKFNFFHLKSFLLYLINFLSVFLGLKAIFPIDELTLGAAKTVSLTPDTLCRGRLCGHPLSCIWS